MSLTRSTLDLQLQFRVGRKTIVYIHVSLVPVLGNGEQKSKPTQHSVRQLRSMGINPDILVCRSPKVLEQGVKYVLTESSGHTSGRTSVRLTNNVTTCVGSSGTSWRCTAKWTQHTFSASQMCPTFIMCLSCCMHKAHTPS